MEYHRGLAIPLVFLAVLLITPGCTGPACSSGNGTVVTEKHGLPQFNSVRFEGPGTLFLNSGEVSSLVLIGDSALLPLYSSRMEGDELVITSNISCLARGSRAPDLYVTGGPISAVTLRGPGNLRAPGPLKAGTISLTLEGSGMVDLPLDCGYLITNLSGTGDVYYQGTAITHEATVTGKGHIRAYDLVTNTTEVKVSGEGGADVFAWDTLAVTISGQGTVRYLGDPEIRKEVTGSGTLTRA